MDNELFDPKLLAYARAFKAITAPLGDCAPRLRLLTVDYKNRAGADCCQDNVFAQTADMTNARLVEIISERYVNQGFSVSAVTEFVMTDIGLVPCFLYIWSKFLAQVMKGG